MLRAGSVLLALPLVLAACGSPESGGAAPALRVVATTAHVADFARQVGGPGVRVDQILPANADPHDYEPRPSDARALAEADVVLRSGGDLDAWLDDLVEAAGGDADQVTLIDAAEPIEAADGVDPHWWQDPVNVVRATTRIAEVLADADPEGADGYERRAGAYEGRVERLDAAIAECIGRVPRSKRLLVTAHDSFRYFARRYELKIEGSIIPSQSTAAQPSAGDIRELVRMIRADDVRTIFPEGPLNPRLERAVARDSGARVGPALYADALGAEGSDGATYLGAMAHDAAAIAEGLAGVRCELPRPPA